jgi:N-acetyl-beta-hexosaminidase
MWHSAHYPSRYRNFKIDTSAYRLYRLKIDTSAYRVEAQEQAGWTLDKPESLL